MHSQYVSHEFYCSLMGLILAARQRIIAVGAEHGLTAIQAITIFMLDASLPRPMKEFCSLYHCDASNVTGIIDGLEKRGLVSRQNDPHDRRVKIIQLEAKGKKLQKAINERLTAENDFLFESLNDEEARQFIHLVEKITAITPSSVTLPSQF